MDGSVAADNYAAYQSLFNGPEAATDRSAFNSNAGGHIKLRDFTVLQSALAE